VEPLEVFFVGFGNVARRAVRLLDEMRGRLPFEWKAVAVMTGRHGWMCAPHGLDMPAVLATIESGRPLSDDAGGDTVNRIAELCAVRGVVAREGRLVCIETTLLDIRAGEPATSHVRVALDGGAHVVSANKGPAAFAYRELADRARARNRRFLFEGAVMDGIPVLNLLRETLPGVVVTGFRGVINSTTNHILTALERGETFDAALARMQAEGIAEADPALDVDGWDAAAKVAVLMNVWMDARVKPGDIEREGIRGVSTEDVRAAVQRGERVRLVGSATRDAGRVAGRVRLEHVPAHDPLGSLEGQQNALLIRTDVLGEIGILQRDGGLTQTAYAIVSDLATIARSPS
jgi:homoserine dehydrogenase